MWQISFILYSKFVTYFTLNYKDRFIKEFKLTIIK